MIVIDKRSEPTILPAVGVGSIPINTVFAASVGSVKGIFLRTYSGLVNLNDARGTWIGNPTITNYQPLHVELHILREAK